MKYTGPKAKKCRRQNMNLYGADKYDKILQRKPYGPGKGPRVRSGRQSEYGKQLQEKQRVRDIYGLSERQFRRMYEEASRSLGQTGDTLKMLLEQRLDNVVYRAGFALTRLQARQFTGHGLFSVDGIRVTSPSYRVKPGQKITLRSRNADSAVFQSIFSVHEKTLSPPWIKIESSGKSFLIVSLPSPDDAEQSIDMRQVTEFYSRV
jgi:small subunit ribosomal protein S4